MNIGERLKERIDHIALAMIDQTKKSEEMYLKNIKEHFSTYDGSKSLQIKSSEIEELFRNPNLLIQTIQEIQQKQEESLKDIRSKLYKMTIVKEFCEETNTFQPNSTSFNQKEETSLFGSIQLNQYSNLNSLKSKIIKGERQSFDLIKLCELALNDTWTVLYRGTRDGFEARDFH